MSERRLDPPIDVHQSYMDQTKGSRAFIIGLSSAFVRMLAVDEYF